MRASALMKLNDHHSCDAAESKSNSMEPHDGLLRELMQRSIQSLKEIPPRITNFAQILEQRISASGIDSISPFALHSLYRASVALSWIAAETNDERYITAKSICARLLQTMNTRWKAAGSFLFRYP